MPHLGAIMLGALTRALVPPYRADRAPSRRVAVVVPLSSRVGLLPEEEVSMRHLCHYLGHYDKFLVAPTGANVQRDGFTTVHFSPRFFGSAAAHNTLIFWPRFYRQFQDYEYILMYHLDSLVFSDQLLRWCESGLDYIGAPWIPCPETPWVSEPKVGNGGFTLMKIDSLLRVLNNRYRQEPLSFWGDWVARQGRILSPLYRRLDKLPPRLKRPAVIQRMLRHWHVNQDPAAHGYNNDYFWSFWATRYLPGFTVATVEDGLRFAFEAAPRACFQMNHRQLPFGCHAWTKFDQSFWEPHLLPADRDRRSTVPSVLENSARDVTAC